jgi:tRNA-2-methylthio-N6-dimethylallyladenosine synthase
MPADEFVNPEVAQARLEELIEVSRGIQAEINAGEVGRVEEVLVEKVGRRAGQVVGKTRRHKVVAFDADAGRIGCYTHVELRHTTGPTFGGVELAEAAAPA